MPSPPASLLIVATESSFSGIPDVMLPTQVLHRVRQVADMLVPKTVVPHLDTLIPEQSSGSSLPSQYFTTPDCADSIPSPSTPVRCVPWAFGDPTVSTRAYRHHVRMSRPPKKSGAKLSRKYNWVQHNPSEIPLVLHKAGQCETRILEPEVSQR